MRTYYYMTRTLFIKTASAQITIKVHKLPGVRVEIPARSPASVIFDHGLLDIPTIYEEVEGDSSDVTVYVPRSINMRIWLRGTSTVTAENFENEQLSANLRDQSKLSIEHITSDIVVVIAQNDSEATVNGTINSVILNAASNAHFRYNGSATHAMLNVDEHASLLVNNVAMPVGTNTSTKIVQPTRE